MLSYGSNKELLNSRHSFSLIMALRRATSRVFGLSRQLGGFSQASAQEWKDLGVKFKTAKTLGRTQSTQAWNNINSETGTKSKASSNVTKSSINLQLTFKLLCPKMMSKACWYWNLMTDPLKDFLISGSEITVNVPSALILMPEIESTYSKTLILTSNPERSPMTII